jgi:hypothetical protein
MTITTLLQMQPGVHHGISAELYHADALCSEPTLSSSIAKTLLLATPRHAWKDHPRLNPNFEATSDKKFALGAVVHELLLGKGGGFEEIEASDFRSKDAKAARDAAIARGKTPILTDQLGAALIMRDAVIERLSEISETAGLIGDDGLTEGHAETVILWRDIGGPLCRAMIDFWGATEAEVWDIKTIGAGLSDGAIRRQIENIGYDLSAGFYVRGLEALRPELAGRFVWRWIFVEDEEPFEVRVIEPDGEMLEIGKRKAALAIAKWHAALTADHWPGYPREVTRLAPAPWSQPQLMERELADPDARRAVYDNRVVEREPQKLYGAC